MTLSFEPWLSVARALASALTFLAGLDEKRRIKAAAYLDEIAKTLDAMALSGMQGVSVARFCAALETYTRNLHAICRDVAPAAELIELGAQLNRAATSPGDLTVPDQVDRFSANERIKATEQLQAAAESFRATAVTLRAM